MYSRKPGFLASLKPSPDKDDARELIRTAVFLGDDKMHRVLLAVGFPLNCKPNGGSQALDALFGGRTLKHHVPMPDFSCRHLPPPPATPASKRMHSSWLSNRSCRKVPAGFRIWTATR